MYNGKSCNNLKFNTRKHVCFCFKSCHCYYLPHDKNVLKFVRTITFRAYFAAKKSRYFEFTACQTEPLSNSDVSGSVVQQTWTLK